MAPHPVIEVELREGTEGLSPARVATLYRRAPLLRPTDDAARVAKALPGSDLILSAWVGGRLVGLARVLTDGVEVAYLCDLAVEPDVQGLGVGKRLIDGVLERCRGAELVLRDSSLSHEFFSHLGFAPVANAWARRA
ncbi:MAG TPA: GNAT family N-acetyltransferase [Rhodothermales bacterium]|nr:GNAT family N-acetyltransferase [Rhodothermales bacterium]